MSDRNRLVPQQVIGPTPPATAGDMDDDIISLPTNVNMFSVMSYTIVWTGTPEGVFTVEVSNDYVPANSDKPAYAGNWVALTLSETVEAVGDAGSAFIDIDIMGAAWVRLKYTSDTGDGACVATFAGKCA